MGPLKMSRPKFKIKRAFLQINNVSSLPESNSRMDGLCQTTISKRNLPCIWFSVSVVVNNYFVSHFLISPGFYHPKLKKKKFFYFDQRLIFFCSQSGITFDLFEEFEKIN